MSSIKLTRYSDRPVLSPIPDAAHWWESRSVFNAGVAVHNNKIYILYRAIGHIHYSHFGLAILSDPATVVKRFEHPIFEPEQGNKYEQFGVEDPRIIPFGNTYYIVYNAPSIYPTSEKALVNAWDHMVVPWRIRCSLAQTDDFVHFKRHGVIMPDIDTKNGVLFPEKINGQYVLLHRIFPDIWISFSDTITHFEIGTVLAKARKGNWDSERIGAGAPPIKTELGWLNFYHGVEKHHDGSYVYRTGILLLDLNDPTKILYRSSKPILEPEMEYEKTGYVKNVVFACGAIEWEDRYYVYYGAADTRIGVAYISKKELMEYLKSRMT